jgi:hypothetical protein
MIWIKGQFAAGSSLTIIKEISLISYTFPYPLYRDQKDGSGRFMPSIPAWTRTTICRTKTGRATIAPQENKTGVAGRSARARCNTFKPLLPN